MNRAGLFIIWAVLAWMVPAAIAGQLGWPGIWGSGGAFVDYLIPLPVAGGTLHLPSFLVVSAILFTQPWKGGLGGYARATLAAGALAGVVVLLDLQQLRLALTSDGVGTGIWQRQPVGLFLLSDCVLAQFFMGATGGRWPEGARQWATCLLLVLALPGVYAATAMQVDPRGATPFVFTGARAGEQRGDESVFYYSALSTRSEAFREAALAVAQRHDPASNVNSEAIAVHFFDSLASAQSQLASDAGYTACLYQDGTPASWHPGYADCFGAHESFSERVEKVYALQDPGLPAEVRAHLALRAACADRELAQRIGVPTESVENGVTRACDPARADREREDLLKRFGSDARIAELLQGQLPDGR